MRKLLIKYQNLVTTISIPILPEVPNIKPDELLGSWFSRVASANQAATWNHLLRQCGYKLNSQPPVDVASPSERYELLCGALGKSYANLTLAKTTLPFWLFFEASSTKNLYEGDVKIPMRVIAGHDTQSSSRIRGKLGHLKYCACCLNEQLAGKDGTYWRRSHQLPVSLVCHLHSILLRSACYKCGRIPEMHKQRILKLPGQYCACEADLTVPPTPSEKSSKGFVALSQFAIQAMNAGLPMWNRTQVLDLALAMIDQDCGGKVTIAFDAMETYFGLHRYGKYGLRYLNIEIDPEASSLVLQGVPSVWSASTFAAFFVASGTNLVDLQNRLNGGALHVTGTGATNALRTVAGSSEPAEKDFNLFQGSRPSRRRAEKARVYPVSDASTNPTQKLYEALQRVLNSQRQPSRVRIFELALSFGATEQKLRKHIASAPEFTKELARVNKAYPIERIRWKLGQLNSEQRCMSTSALLLEINLQRSRSNAQLVVEIAKERSEWAALLLTHPYDTLDTGDNS